MIMADGFTGLLGWSWHSTPISFKAWTNCWTCRYCQSSVKKHGWDGGSIEVYFTYTHISCLAVFGLTSDTPDLEVSDLHILRERT